MKPYNITAKIKGSGSWKKDYHIRKNNRKVENWWEGLWHQVSRRKIKQELMRSIKNPNVETPGVVLKSIKMEKQN